MAVAPSTPLDAKLEEQRRHGFNAGELVYTAPPAVPTQQGPRGIRFDGNDGCRVLLPEGKWRVRLSDLDTGNILFESETGGVLVKYQIKVAGHVEFNGNERDVDRTTTVEIKDVDKTKIEIPEEAKKKIG